MSLASEPSITTKESGQSIPTSSSTAVTDGSSVEGDVVSPFKQRDLVDEPIANDVSSIDNEVRKNEESLESVSKNNDGNKSEDDNEIGNKDGSDGDEKDDEVVQDEDEDENEDDGYDPELALAVPDTVDVRENSSTGSEMSNFESSHSKADANDASASMLASEVSCQQTTEVNENGATNKTLSDVNADDESISTAKVLKESLPDKPVSSSPSENTVETSIAVPTHTFEKAPEPDSDDDDYDPEMNLVPVSSKPEHASSLPQRPSVVEEIAPHVIAPPVKASDLKEAYEAVMQSEVVRSAHFSQLSKEKQMEVISQLLKEKQIELPGTTSGSMSDLSQEKKAFTGSTSESQQTNAAKISADDRPDVTMPMTEDEAQAYEEFLKTESEFLSSNLDLPEDSRLFVGNLAANFVTKQDIFRLFRRYGELVEISLKPGYGFAQFKTSEACAACKSGEMGMPLHGRSMRLDSSHKRKPAHPTTDFGGRGRERFVDDQFDESDSKRSRPNAEDIHVIKTAGSSRELVSEFESVLEKDHLTHSLKSIESDDPADEIRDAAYSGVLGACVIKNSKVDLQIFEETGDGGVKFDEYLEIEPSAASEIIVAAKRSREDREIERQKQNTGRRRDRFKGSSQGPPHHSAREFTHDRRRFPEKPYNHHHNDSHSNGNRGWHGGQQNRGFLGNHGYKTSREDGGRNFSHYERGPPYNSGMNYQQPGYNMDQGNGDQQYRSGNRFFNDNPNPAFHQNNTGTRSGQTQNFRGPTYGGLESFVSPAMPSFPPQQFPPSTMGAPDPALVQTLQNLDPNTMRSVVALLQQQNDAPGALRATPGYQRPSMYSDPVSMPSFAQSSPSAQVNSLLSQLQSQPAPPAVNFQTNYPQHSQHSQPPYNNSPSQQVQPNQALMDMLARLGQ